MMDYLYFLNQFSPELQGIKKGWLHKYEYEKSFSLFLEPRMNAVAETILLTNIMTSPVTDMAKDSG